MAAGFVLKIVLSQGDNAYMMGLYIIEQLVRLPPWIPRSAADTSLQFILLSVRLS